MTSTSTFTFSSLALFNRPIIHSISFSPDLAVIFRPGLISHPQHEMSPPEHALSQRVLEFLIAQQDWFMLDIAPPPGGNQAAPWDQGVGSFEGKWKEGTVGGHSREGSRVGTPNANAEAGPSSMQKVQLGQSKHPHLHPQAQAQAHVQAPSPRQAYNAQLQQSQMPSIPQSQSPPLPQPQPFQPQPIPQQQQHADHQHPISHTNSGYGSEVDDVMVIPNSDDEYDDGWKMVSAMQGGGGGGGGVGSGFMASGGGKDRGEGFKVGFREDRDMEKGREREKGIKSMRRRTTLDKSGKGFFLSLSRLLTNLLFNLFIFKKNQNYQLIQRIQL